MKYGDPQARRDNFGGGCFLALQLDHIQHVVAGIRHGWIEVQIPGSHAVCIVFYCQNLLSLLSASIFTVFSVSRSTTIWVNTYQKRSLSTGRRHKVAYLSCTAGQYFKRSEGRTVISGVHIARSRYGNNKSTQHS